ncbi:MAG: glutamate formimidoyltransferase, partial [Flavobacteriales bacterium]|nr:glutamate formimidoyltransferase [Flavobacteriales bacterium]
MKRIIECIPNFSEGVNSLTLETIARAIRKIDGVQLLHQDSGNAANRTVFTFAGEVHSIFEAAYQAIKIATEMIDMTVQKGAHPRIGACDVCPFVPISEIEMKELIPLVNQFAAKVSTELNVPIYLYEESASTAIRRNLAKHRIGEYEKLQSRVKNKKWLPDFGSYN